MSRATEFGTWFGVKFDGSFTPGAHMRGVIVPTTVNAEVAKTQQAYEGQPFELTIEQMDPERLFSYRWHPYAVEPSVDYATEPTTLVEFHLAEVVGGTQLTVIESGFDSLPAARRADAFRMNDQGWAAQMTNIERYVTA